MGVQGVASTFTRGGPVPLPRGSPCPSTPAWPALAFGVFGSPSGGRGHVHQSCGAHGVVITTEPLKGAPRNQAQVQANCGMNPSHTLHDMRSPYGMVKTDCFGGGRMVTNVFEPIFKCFCIAWNKMGEVGPNIPCRQMRNPGRKGQLLVCQGHSPGWKLEPSLLNAS